LHVRCEGTGSPAVLLEAGAGAPGDSEWGYATVFPAVARFTRVCVYDRAGLGASPPPPRTPRTCEELTADLHAVADAVRIERPFVLVGHSFGGLLARFYARAWPGELSGVVFVDPAVEENLILIRRTMTPEQRAYLDREVAGRKEKVDRPGCNDRVGATGTLGDVPLVLIVATRVEPLPSDLPQPQAPVAAVYARRREMMRKFLTLSTRTREVMAARSGHVVMKDEPEIVIGAIRDLVMGARAAPTR
jgi:pimeloyl-ACP methyl ester carboxylesterase